MMLSNTQKLNFWKEKDKCVYIYTINHKENEDENEKWII